MRNGPGRYAHLHEEQDVPGVIGHVGTVLGRNQINIANFSLGRRDAPTAPANRSMPSHWSPPTGWCPRACWRSCATTPASNSRVR